MDDKPLAAGFDPVIDAHTHVGVIWPDEWICVPPERCIEMMDRTGVRVACTSASRYLRFDFREGNRMTRDVAARYPDRLIGFAVADPLRARESADDIDRLVGEEGFGGVKLHISHTRMPYDHPAHDPIYTAASRHGVPVLAHVFSRPEVLMLCDAARRFPDIPFLFGHSGGYDWLNCVDDIAAVPNAYFDLCCSTVDHGRVEAFVAAAGAERVLMGTDLPMLHPASVISQVVHADLTDAEKGQILGGNMACLLGVLP